MAAITETSLYKKFIYERFVNNESRGMINVTQTNEKNALSKLYQYFGGKKNAKKHGITLTLVNVVDIKLRAGQFLTFVGKEKKNLSFSEQNCSDDFIIGNRYEIMKSGKSLYVLSEKGVQTKINPIVFCP